MTEAAAVSPEGRISPQDLGLWNDEQIPPLARIASFLSAQGSVPAIQLAHAGRKASTKRSWDGGGPASSADGGWSPVLAPSAVPFDDGWQMPQALDEEGMARLVDDFASATRRAATAGFRVGEIHAAHGYLLHEFLSPISNRRADDFGGSLENRMRFPLRVVEAVVFTRQAHALGVDLVDCSSGGMHPRAHVPAGPGYQVPFAARIRAEAGVATAAVGLITTARQAADIVESGQADLVLLGREMLRSPYWALRASAELGTPLHGPRPYERPRPYGTVV